MNPLVSIILPTYKDAKGIREAIESVQKQDFSNWELIVIDDGLYEDSKAAVHLFTERDNRIIYIANADNIGIQKSLNHGLARARGEYVARIDDDDVWIDSDKLSKQIDFLQHHPDHVLVGTDAIVVDENRNVLSVNIMPKNDKAIRSKMLSKNCFLHSTILAKKSTIEKVGGYSEKKEILHAEDYDLWLKLGTEGKLANLEVKSTTLTAHGSSLTAQNRVMQARHVLRVILANRKKYPHFLSGYTMATARFIAFYIFGAIPLPISLFYKIQRMYRSV